MLIRGYLLYAGGMPMPGRVLNSPEYRFGYNGMEKDDEVSGNASSYTAEFWQYDSRLQRRWNIDPVRVAWESVYAAFRNNAIIFNDPNGDCPDCPKNSKDFDTYEDKGGKNWMSNKGVWTSAAREVVIKPEPPGIKDFFANAFSSALQTSRDINNAILNKLGTGVWGEGHGSNELKLKKVRDAFMVDLSEVLDFFDLFKNGSHKNSSEHKKDINDKYNVKNNNPTEKVGERIGDGISGGMTDSPNENKLKPKISIVGTTEIIEDGYQIKHIRNDSMWVLDLNKDTNSLYIKESIGFRINKNFKK